MFGHGATGQFAIGQFNTGAGGGAENITVDKWFELLSEPVRIKQGLGAGSQPFAFFHPSPLVSFGWMALLSEPVRIKLSLPAGENLFLAFNPQPFVSFGWFNELSKPQKLDKTGLPAPEQPFLALQPAPSPFVATGWYNWLSEPVRLKPGLPSGEQQFISFNPQPFVSFSWFDWLSEPVRLKQGLGSPLQQFFALDTSVIPLQKLIEWFAPFSDPVRIKPGLITGLQQFLAHPPRLLPNANIIGTMSAQEMLDAFLAGLQAYNRVVSADVAVREILRTLSPVGIIEQIQKSANVGVQASLPITTSGSPVAPTYTARVAIREV